MNDLTMRVELQIFGSPNQGSLRLTEEFAIRRPITLEEAAKILTRFSDLAKEVQQGPDK
jgi:hypothetical protein